MTDTRTRRGRRWIVQLGTNHGQWLAHGEPQEIASDLTDPEDVGSVLLTGYIAEHAGQRGALDQLRARVWHPYDHDAGRDPIAEVGPIESSYPWGAVVDATHTDSQTVSELARDLPTELLLGDGTGVTADGYTRLVQAATQ